MVSSSMDSFETARFILRKFTEKDTEGLFELDSDPEVHRYIGNKPLRSVDEAKKVIQNIMEQYRTSRFGRLAVIERSTGNFVGWAGIKLETVEVNGHSPYYDLGYRLIRKYWGKGIATECALASMEIGFREYDIDVIHAGAHIQNIQSNRVLHKAGLRKLNTFEFDGAMHHWYEITRNEWKERYDRIK